MTLKNYKQLAGVFILAAMLVLVTYGQAYALRIIPQRLVLKPDVKVEYMFVKNNSDKVETFRFGWKHMAMDKEGNVLNLDKLGMENAPSGYRPADDIIRFSPRRAVLQPGQTQRITFMVKRSPSLQAGEYRSHFLFQREPNAGEVTEPDAATPGSPEASKPNVAFDVLVSRAVPVYVIHGETSAKLNFLGASVEKNVHKRGADQPDFLVRFKVQKEGNRSVIGIAQILCNSGGEEVVISKPSKIFAVYAEGEFREEQLGINMPANGCSSYRLLVKGHPDDMLAGQVLIDQAF